MAVTMRRLWNFQFALSVLMAVMGWSVLPADPYVGAGFAFFAGATFALWFVDFDGAIRNMKVMASSLEEMAAMNRRLIGELERLANLRSEILSSVANNPKSFDPDPSCGVVESIPLQRVGGKGREL
jgi:hypothetical protein